MDHVKEGGLNGKIPMIHKGKCYDISFLDENGEVIMIEIMRTYRGLDGKDKKG